MIKVENCYKSFPQKDVLKGVSFEVTEKSIFGFIGINGAGKSTLIKCLLKFIKPQKGEIYLSGKPVSKEPDFQKKIGYLPEIFQPPYELKCNEFLNYCYLLIKNRHCPENEINNLLNKVGLTEAKDQLIKKLSKGMRQRLGIAQTLIHHPDLLILDEPFSGLDPIGRYDLKQLIRSIHKEGLTIFFSSHNLAEIQDLCSHVAVLHMGQIIFQGTITEFLTKYETNNFEKAFLCAIGNNFQKEYL